MKTSVVALALVACGSKSTSDCPPPTPAQIAKAPELRLPDDAAPLKYHAKLEVNPGTTTFAGHIEIEVTLKRAVDMLWLNAHELTIGKAVLRRGGSETALTAVAQPRNFVGLSGVMPAGDATLVIDYTGPQQYGRSQGMGRYTDAGNDYVVTHFEPHGARRVFPSFDEPAFKVPWQLEITVPGADTAFTNTPMVKVDPLPDGRKHFVFAPTKPLPSYLIAIAVGKFDTVDAGVSRSGAPMRILVPAGRGKDAAFAAAETGKVLAALEDYTGIPYPYEKLDHVAVPGTQMGAMEHPGLVTYGPRYLLIPDDESVTIRRSHVGIVAHELAHQWFGDLVTTAWWDDIWLNEAFATWLAPKAMQATHPEMDGAIDPVATRGEALSADALVSARKIRQPIEREADMKAAFDGITYSKGATVIGMFESWIGPDVFQAGARKYLAKHAHRNATAADFLAELSGVTDKPIAAAFGTFLDQPGVPQVDIKLVCEPGKPPRLSLAQRRFVSAGSKPSSALWQIPVCAKAEGPARKPHCTLLDKATGELALDDGTSAAALACPRWVVPNAGGVGYYVSNLPADLLAQTLASGQLSRQERIAMLGDLVMLIDGGHADASTILAQLDKLGASEDPYLVEIALGRLERFVRMVGDDQRDAFAKLVRDTLALHGARLGWLPKRDEPVSEARLRARTMMLLAIVGNDTKARDAALALAKQWLADPSSVPESAWGPVLVTAVRVDPTWVGTLIDRLPKVTDRIEQRTIYSALGAAPDLATLARALALLDGTAPITVEQIGLLRTMPERVDLQVARFDYVRTHKDDLARRMQRDYAGALLVSVCDAKHRDAVATYLRTFVGNPDVGELAVAHEIEAMDLCIARKAAQGPALTKFLAGRGR